ncbi:hypothetical protein HanOQP8_Chr03g0102661 [Helianthus annuus]|nr:hypothetical protein HanOQP8_Chr03g0102661 [Helianthus annuus]
MYCGFLLGRGSVPGFFQPAHSVRQVQTTMTVYRVNLMQTDAADLTSVDCGIAINLTKQALVSKVDLMVCRWR